MYLSVPSAHGDSELYKRMYVYKIQSPIGGAFGVEGQRRQEGEELSASLVSKDKIIVSI